MPKTINSLCGPFVAVLAVGLMILKLWIRFPLPSFAIFGCAFLGAVISLVSRFHLRQKSPWDLVAFVIGGLALIWTIAEYALPH